MRLNRFYGHFEGDAMTYRAPDEVAKARANADPLILFRQRVVEASLLAAGDFEAADKEAASDVAQALAAAKAAPMPTEADLLTDVYLNLLEAIVHPLPLAGRG